MIYTCYAGVGKTTLAEKNEKVIDLDSTLFRLGFRGDFLKDWYIIYTQVAENLSKQGFDVFIGTHEIVRDELKRKGIPFIAIFPALELKEQWIEKLKQRYEAIEAERQRRKEQNDRISAFAATLAERKEIPIEFDDDLWLAAVDHVTVNADETVTFTFKSGIEITEQM